LGAYNQYNLLNEDSPKGQRQRAMAGTKGVVTMTKMSMSGGLVGGALILDQINRIRKFFKLIRKFENPQVSDKLRNLSEVFARKFADDFENLTPADLARFDAKPEMVDAWRQLDKTPFTKDLDALEYVSDVMTTTRVGLASTTDYVTTWRNKFPNLQGGSPGQYFNVHHAIERQVLTRWPGVFNELELHSLSNLRGVSGELNSSFHLSRIRNRWDDFYADFPPGGAIPTRQQLLNHAKTIDDELGKFFSPPVRPVDY